MGSEGMPPGYSYSAPVPGAVARSMAWDDYMAGEPPEPKEDDDDV